MFSKNPDIFEAINVYYVNDNSYVNMEIITYHLLHAIMSNVHHFKNMIKRQNINFESNNIVFTNAGFFFNHLSINTHAVLYNDSEFNEICVAFQNSLKYSSMSAIANKFDDPIDCFIYFTKYLYIPVRLDISSIPKDPSTKKNLILRQFAKLYLTTVSILIQLDAYTIKFDGLIADLEKYKTCMRQIFENEKIEAQIRNVSVENVVRYIKSAYNPTANTAIFYKILIRLIFNISMEIIQKFCPNYKTVSLINRSFDGTWISPLDTDVNNQILKLKNLFNSVNL